jgi:beta-N-acetylglucosaminidase
MESPDLHVESYTGHKGQETPSAFILDGTRFIVNEVIDRWDSDSHSYVRVNASDQHRYVLRYHFDEDRWELVMQERMA